jgi:hypothetical protein
MPADGDTRQYTSVAYLGRVVVRMRGLWEPGWEAVPSGMNDGFATGLDPGLDPQDRESAPAVAWSLHVSHLHIRRILSTRLLQTYLRAGMHWMRLHTFQKLLILRNRVGGRLHLRMPQANSIQSRGRRDASRPRRPRRARHHRSRKRYQRAAGAPDGQCTCEYETSPLSQKE